MMSMDLLQDALVALVAVAAATVLFRRLAGFARPADAAPGCAHCPSGGGACHTPASAPMSTTMPVPPSGVERPLVFVRPSRE